MRTYLSIHVGGSDKDYLLANATSNGLESSEILNVIIRNYYGVVSSPFQQLYIAYRIGSIGPCTACEGFAAKITFENICEKGLDLNNGTLIVHNYDMGFLPLGSKCQWLISAIDDQHYINLEFETLNVRN